MNPTPNTYLDVKQEQFMSTFTTGYELYEDESTIFDIFGGLALTSLSVDLDLTRFPLLGAPVSRTASVPPSGGSRRRFHSLFLQPTERDEKRIALLKGFREMGFFVEEPMPCSLVEM